MQTQVFYQQVLNLVFIRTFNLHIHNTVCIFRTRVQTIYKSYHVEIHTQMVNTRWLAILHVFGYSVERKVFIKL